MTLGARLRHRREEQNVDLVAISELTKIKVSLLQALERDDVSQWPSGIFRRAFIRSYAKAIGLAPDVVLREFLEVHPDPSEPPAVPATGGDAEAMQSRRTSGGIRHHLSSLFRAPRDAEAPVIQRPPASVPQKEPVIEVAAAGPDLLAVARLCTGFSRAETASDVQPLLREALRILSAKGLIVWLWDAAAAALRPVLACGYPHTVVARLPSVKRDENNATAAAFRSAETCAIDGGDCGSGALAVPLLTPAGCAGVLAIELHHGNEKTRAARAVATIVAALLAQLVGGMAPADGAPSDVAFVQSPPPEPT